MSEQSSNSIHNEQSQQQLDGIIHVNDPRKEIEQQSTFISYLVQSNVRQK